MADKDFENLEKDPDIDDFDLSELDDDFDLDSEFDDLGFGSSPKPKGKRKPIEDVGLGISDAVKNIKITEPPGADVIADAFPKTGKLFDVASDAASMKYNIQQEATKELTPAINQMKQAGRRIMPKIEGLVPKKIYDKIYNKLQPNEIANRQVDLEAEREEIVSQQLESIFKAEQEQAHEEKLQERTDKYIQDAISRGEHKDEMSILSGIKAYEHVRTKFTLTTLQGYIAKSLELKYKHMFIAKDTFGLLKGFVSTTEKRLESIVHNTALPDFQKKRTMESIKEAQRQLLIGKGMSTVGEWTKDFRKNLMQNTKAFASDSIQKLKSGLEDVGGMANQYMDLQDMNAEFSTPEDERSAVASGTSFLAGLAMTRAGKAIAKKIVKLSGQHGIDMENFSESILEKTKYSINDKLQDKQGGMWEVLKKIIPTIDTERGGRQKNLMENALEEVPWNVMDHRALVEIIPGYLAKSVKLLTDISTGRTDSPELIFDPKKEDFVEVDKFKEGLKKKYFGTQESRTNEVADGVAKLLGAYSIQGGDEAKFYDSMQDIIKFLNNSAKHLQNIDPSRIIDMAKSDDWTDAQKRYADKVFLDMDDEGKKNVLDILSKSFKTKDDSVNREVGIDIDNFVKRLSRDRDDRLKDIHLSAGVGTARHYNDILNDRGILDHQKARDTYADVDIDKLKETIGLDSKRYAERLWKHDKDRLFTKARYDEAYVPEDTDKELDEKVKDIEARIDKNIERVQRLAEEVEKYGYKEAMEKYRKEQEEEERTKEDLAEEVAETIDEIAEEQKELKKTTKKKKSSKKKKKKKGDDSGPIIKDTPHISGPGIYVQGSEQELHAPLDKLDKVWDGLITKLEKSGISEDIVDTIDVFKDELFDLMRYNQEASELYYDELLDITKDMKSAVISLPKLAMPNIDLKELLKLDPEKPGAFKKVLGGIGSGIGTGWKASKAVIKSGAELGLEGIKGGARFGGKSIVGLGASGLDLIGAGTGLVKRAASGAKDKMPKLLVDLYKSGEDEPFITKKQLKNAVFANGLPVTNIGQIKEPIYDKKTGELLISEEDIKTGLMTKGRKMISEIKVPKLPDIKIDKLKEKGQGLGSKLLSGTGKVLKGSFDASTNIVNKVFGSGTPIAGQIASMGLSAAGKVGNLGLDLTKKVLGLGDGAGLGSSKKILSRLDKIYQLLYERIPDKDGNFHEYEEPLDEEIGTEKSSIGLALKDKFKSLKGSGLGTKLKNRLFTKKAEEISIAEGTLGGNLNDIYGMMDDDDLEQESTSPIKNRLLSLKGRLKENKYIKKIPKFNLPKLKSSDEDKVSIKDKINNKYKEVKDTISEKLSKDDKEEKMSVKDRLSSLMATGKNKILEKNKGLNIFTKEDILNKFKKKEDQPLSAEEFKEITERDSEEDKQNLTEVLKSTLATRFDDIKKLWEERLPKPKKEKKIHDTDGDGFREGSYEEYMQKKKEKEADKNKGFFGRFKKSDDDDDDIKGAALLNMLGLGGGDGDGGGGFLSTMAGLLGANWVSKKFGGLKKLPGKILGGIKKAPGKLFGKLFGSKAGSKAGATAGKKVATSALGKAISKKIPGGKKLAGLLGGTLGLSTLFGSSGDDVAKELGKETIEETTELAGKEITEKAAKETMEKGAKEITKEAVEKGATKGIAKKLGAKTGLKSAGMVGKKIPVLGLAVGAGLAASRLSKGDATGAALEMLSGTVSLVPFFGTAASIAIDGLIIGRDVVKSMKISERIQLPIVIERFKKYLVEPNEEMAENIFALEKRTTKALKSGTPISFFQIVQLSHRFGFSTFSRKQSAFFYRWYKDRFMKVLGTYYGILQSSYGKDVDEETDIPKKDYNKIISLMEKELKDLDLDEDFKPTKEAYKKYIKKYGDDDLKDMLDEKIDFSKREKDDDLNINKKQYDSNKLNESVGGGRSGKGKIIPFDPSLKNQLGSVSAKYESAKEGSSAIGYDLHGGTSYGKYQISSKQGKFEEFLNWVEQQPGGLEIAERLRAAGDANTGSNKGTVPNEWKKLVKEGKMGELEHAYIKQTHYDPLFEKLSPEIKERALKSKALRDVIWSTAVQHGVDNGSSLINGVFKKNMTDIDFVKAIYSERGKRFGSSTLSTQRSVQNRFANEQYQVLAMLNKESNMRNGLSLPSSNNVIQMADAKSTNNTQNILSKERNIDDTGIVTASIKDLDKTNTNLSEIKQTTANISKEIINSNNPEVREKFTKDIATSFPTKLITEDKISHQLTGQQLSELHNIRAGIDALNKNILNAFGNGETFKSMNDALHKSLEKDPTVNIDGRQIISNNNTMGAPKVTDKKQKGIDLTKKRSA